MRPALAGARRVRHRPASEYYRILVIQRIERSAHGFAGLLVVPRRVTLARDEEIVAEVRLLNPAEVERAFTLVVQQRLRGGGEPYRPEVICGSADLLAPE